ncbi:DNA topoisomerase III [Bacillus sp. AFS077874]|uniref:type IA DNA topoisomerase n=1 Tax=Bacillus sp. AFS077874 TaxID=2033513 RepID=UPI000BF39680|nr:type IA DNA topoisomerase [Bacillus sp. AFS077874]PFM75257.1 DNA topoisomerase III [Bacillus sp. AFS077874]
MSRVVILAEKPSQAKAYAEAFSVKNKTKTSIELNSCSTFPNGATITWGIGHLVELKQPEEYNQEWKKWSLSSLPILPGQYEFKIVYGKSEQFNAVKKLFKEADTIINSCDIDREGANIFNSILNLTGVKNKQIKRLWINSLEVDEVRKGFANLHDNQKDLLLYNEAKTRQIADWLVGMNGSRLYTLLLQQKGLKDSLAIGRVQSPTVYLIYQRQLEIENFKPKPFYEIEGDFTVANGNYRGRAKVKSEKKEEVQAILNQHHISGQNEGFVKSITKNEKRTKSPKLHSLSTLQASANKKWKTSPANVLKTMQSLYEKKLVTYPRTDTQFITENEYNYLVSNVENYQKIVGQQFDYSKVPNKRYVDGSKVQEHYAIIPTKTIPSESTLQDLTGDEKNIYFEVLRTTLGMFHSDYICEETKVVTDVKNLEFETTGNIEISKGWKELFKNDEKNENQTKNEGSQALPVFQKNERVVSVVKLKEGTTTAPKPYTEGELISMMKTCGKLVENEEEMEILKEVEGLGTEATRSGIIETIKKHGYIEVKKNMVSVTEKGKILCQSIEGNLLSSPSMTAKWEGYLHKIGSGEGSQDVFLSNIEKFLTNLINEVPGKLNSDSINNGIETVQKADEIGQCPKCKKGSIVHRKTFYSCTTYKDGCKFLIPGTFLGKSISTSNAQKLLNGKKTGLIKGLKGKSGKEFDAYLKLNQVGKIEFEFNNQKFFSQKK